MALYCRGDICSNPGGGTSQYKEAFRLRDFGFFSLDADLDRLRACFSRLLDRERLSLLRDRDRFLRSLDLERFLRSLSLSRFLSLSLSLSLSRSLDS